MMLVGPRFAYLPLSHVHNMLGAYVHVGHLQATAGQVREGYAGSDCVRLTER